MTIVFLGESKRLEKQNLSLEHKLIFYSCTAFLSYNYPPLLLHYSNVTCAFVFILLKDVYSNETDSNNMHCTLIV